MFCSILHMDTTGTTTTTKDYEWSTRDSSGLGWIAPDETTARERLDVHPAWTLHRRQRWVSYGEFEDVL